jgi:hypothetical protein
VQETGHPDQSLAIVPSTPSAPSPFLKVAVLQGQGTLGPSEAFSSALKHQSIPVFGERSAGLGVERTRFLLKVGGAAEVVNKRWVGASGEYLGMGGEKPAGRKAAASAPESDAPKAPGLDTVKATPVGYGVVPDHPLKGLKPDEDPLPRILEALGSGPKTARLLQESSAVSHPYRVSGPAVADFPPCAALDREVA